MGGGREHTLHLGLIPALPFHCTDLGKLLKALCLSFCICKVEILLAPNS